MSRPISCQVLISALQHNLQVARRKAQMHPIWAVIKANAYGHGTAEAVRGFSHADGLAMLDFPDAVLCRTLGWNKPILMLEGVFTRADIEVAVAQRLDLVVHSEYQLDWIQQALESVNTALHLHVKVNTGMNRLGFAPDKLQAVLDRIRRQSLASQVTVVTHFANADMSPNDAQERPMLAPSSQLTAFVAAGAHIAQSSIANSAAVLTQIQLSTEEQTSVNLNAQAQSSLLGWIRPGIMLYGATPFGHRSAHEAGLQPAMVFSSRIIATQFLKAGDQVGYGSRFTAPTKMRIGIVACGYADGYPRHAASGTPIAVDGQRSVTVGRVSMDMLAIDLTPFPASDIGSAVQLWGDLVSVDEVAQAAGTIGYELLCAIAPRVPRFVVG